MITYGYYIHKQILVKILSSFQVKYGSLQTPCQCQLLLYSSWFCFIFCNIKLREIDKIEFVIILNIMSDLFHKKTSNIYILQTLGSSK